MLPTDHANTHSQAVERRSRSARRLEEERRLRDDGRAPDELLDGEAGDRHHRGAAVLNLGLLERGHVADVGHLERQGVERDRALASREAEGIEAEVAAEADDEREGVVEQVAVEERRRLAVRREVERLRVELLGGDPAEGGEHREPRVLELRVAHPRERRRALLLRHRLDRRVALGARARRLVHLEARLRYMSHIRYTTSAA